jgi:tRNA/tmRNA/rRNA uracil-C5-methylase (TrmA/RlmC/RlmD family)/23S rRNA-/tRNA-specific pseudouridylate synthase
MPIESKPLSLRCPHAPPCPGCPLIHEPYAEGLAHKSTRSAELFESYPELAHVVLAAPLGADAIVDYRVRAKLVSDGRTRLGLFAAGTHDVVDIPHCLVLGPELRAAADALRRSLPLPLPISGVDLRRVDRGVLVTLISEGEPEPAALAAATAIVRERVPELVGLAVSPRDPDAVQMLGRGPEPVWGSSKERHHLAPDAPWHYAVPGAFTQAHAGQAARLHAHVEQELARALDGLAGRRVLELYAGSGALALRLSARGAAVTAVERFEPALELLAEAARAQSLTLTLAAEDAARFLGQHQGRERFDAVIVNPPRRGLEPAVRRAIAALEPRALVYVSCEPRTLARDLAHLARLGLAARSVLPLDMIPLSDAVECCALLVPAPPPAPSVLYEDEHSLALDKAPFEDAHTGKDSLVARARRTLGLPELVPLIALERDTSGVCWFARTPAAAASLLASAASAELSFSALAHGISHKKGKIERRGKEQHLGLRYVRRSVRGGHSLLDVITDRASQRELCRLLASIGHPVLGDERHGKSVTNRYFEHRHGLDRPLLHCARIRLSLPDKALVIEAPPSADLAHVLGRLEPKDRPRRARPTPTPER